jgi:hypothetical protein
LRREIYILTMLERFSVPQCFLVGGGAVVALGLVLWYALPVPLTFPPYLVTGLLALGYGLVGLTRGRATGKGKAKA